MVFGGMVVMFLVEGVLCYFVCIWYFCECCDDLDELF